MSDYNKTLGNSGEDEAEGELKRLGYTILERNHRNKIGEIDIIGKDGETLCFVEVKTKTGSGFGTPEEMVNFRKQNKLIKTAEYYLNDNEIGQDIDWRIDVVAVDREKDQIRLIRNAVVKGLY